MLIVNKKLDEICATNVIINHKPFDFVNPVGFDTSEYLTMFDREAEYDIVIIDGQDETFVQRLECFRYVEGSMKSGGIIVVDDWWRYTELLNQNLAQSVKIFESVGPCRLGVTSTAFFHY